MDAAEALALAGPRAAVSHELAALAAGVELVEDGERRLTVPRNRSRLRVPGWQVHRHDLGPDEVEEVDGVRRTTVLDFCWPAARLVVEADGFAFHSDRAAYRRDRERLNDLERCGWRVLRFTWEDVVHRPEHVLAVVQECLEAQAA